MIPTWLSIFKKSLFQVHGSPLYVADAAFYNSDTLSVLLFPLTADAASGQRLVQLPFYSLTASINLGSLKKPVITQKKDNLLESADQVQLT